MDDNSLMPFGEHIRKRLADVPAGYFIWLYDNNRLDGQQELLKYISERLKDLRDRAAKEKEAWKIQRGRNYRF